jgi:hypothetical protein
MNPKDVVIKIDYRILICFSEHYNSYLVRCVLQYLGTSKENMIFIPPH